MYVFRSLFWFAVVALLMPQGPGFGFNLDRVRTDLSANHPSIHRLIELAPLRDQVNAVIAARLRARDPVEIWRNYTLDRLATVRAEIAQDRAHRSSDWAATLVGFVSPLP